MLSRLPKFECIKCGDCCRRDDLIVTVTGFDIVRIVRTLGLSNDEALRAFDFYVLDEDTDSKGMRDIPPVMTEVGEAYVALKKMSNAACIFLKDNLCMIHAVRPSVCKSFPFVFNRKDSRIKWGLSALKEICHGLGKGKAVKSSDLRLIAIQVLEELEIYRQFVREWNRSTENPTAAGFLDAVLSDRRFYA